MLLVDEIDNKEFLVPNSSVIYDAYELASDPVGYLPELPE